MDREAIADMAARVEAEQLETVEFESEGEGASGQAYANDNGPELPELGLVLGKLIQSVGNVACARAGVAAISDKEASAIGDAAANVAALYDVDVSPEVAAWLGLGMVSFSVLAPRLDEYSRTIEADVDAQSDA